MTDSERVYETLCRQGGAILRENPEEPTVSGRDTGTQEPRTATGRLFAVATRNGYAIGTGIGRTGMFAVAFLIKLRYSYNDTLSEIRAVESYPEKIEQRDFLAKKEFGRLNPRVLRNGTGRHRWTTGSQGGTTILVRSGR